MEYNFEWNPRKAHTNARKHGVTFQEATGVFNDPMAVTVFDEEESTDDEDRWITLTVTTLFPVMEDYIYEN